MKFVRAAQLVTLAVLVCLPVVWLKNSTVLAQNEASANVVQLQAEAVDKIAAESVTNHQVHILPVRSKAETHWSPLATRTSSSHASSPTVTAESAEAASTSSIPSVPAPGFYPDDLGFSGGKVLTTTQFNNLYVNCAASCWGTPTTFQAHLGASNFIHVTDQYVGTTANNRYTVGVASSIKYPILATLADSDVLQIVHAGARMHGSGYDHFYHVFLPKGVDVCFTGTTQCYSPDNPSTFVFCAYHGSADFSDIGHVIFSVEPYQAVLGCNVPQPSPNGELIDSTSSVLSHETIEGITDPDPPLGWTAKTGLIVFGAEIGDLCENTTFKYGPINLSGKNYEIQPEYSNKFHACATVP